MTLPSETCPMEAPYHLRVVFAVCTRNRPEMLRHCLATVLNMETPRNLDLEVSVVDNSENPAIRERNRNAASAVSTAIPVVFLHEPKTGIPFARNRAIGRALDVNADALVFLDDDQTVPANWLTVVNRVAREEAADAVKSGVTFIFEGEARFAGHFAKGVGILPREERHRNLRYMSTNGVWISCRLFRDLGLRFDEKLGFLGCDDTAFFLEAFNHQARLVATTEVFAQEIVLSQKQNLPWLTRRNFRGGVSRAILRLNGRSRAFYLLSGSSQFLLHGLLSLTFVWWQARLARHYLRSVHSAGIAWGALGGSFNEYRSTAGK